MPVAQLKLSVGTAELIQLFPGEISSLVISNDHASQNLFWEVDRTAVASGVQLAAGESIELRRVGGRSLHLIASGSATTTRVWVTWD